MGQYYKPIILAEDKKTPLFKVETWDFQSGMKLTEHSYIGNPVLGAIEKMICDKPSCLVWGGDYADVEVDNTDNLYFICESVGESITPTLLNKVSKIKIEKLVDNLCNFSNNKSQYIINHSKKQFVDKSKCPYYMWQEYKYALHPLALLTAEGNGRGGGDYEGTNMELIGSWSRDFISVSANKPTDDFVEIVPNFVEDWVATHEKVVYPSVELVNVE